MAHSQHIRRPGLAADPLKDIANTHEIRSIVLGATCWITSGSMSCSKKLHKRLVHADRGAVSSGHPPTVGFNVEIDMTPELKRVARVADVPKGRALAVEIDGHSLAVFNVDGELKVVEATCARHGAPLEKGAVVEESLHCPWHGATFDLESGVCSAFPDESSGTVYEVIVDGGDVFVRI